jgi:hypothetical protein
MKILVFALLIVSCLTLSYGIRIRMWTGTTCSGDPIWDVKTSDNHCGKDNSNGVITIYDPIKDVYTVRVYTSSSCSGSYQEYTIDGKYVGKCQPLLIVSMMITISPACFPGESTVQLEDGSQLALAHLTTGTKIESYASGSNTSYSEVYTFIDKQPSHRDNFFEFEYEQGSKTGVFRVSPAHLVLSKLNGAQTFVQASELRIGDTLYKSVSGSVEEVTITNKNLKEFYGVYAPVTFDGTLVVDGIIASNYAFVNHDVSHAVFAPLRLAYSYLPSSLLPSEPESGMHSYANIFYNVFGDYIQNNEYFSAAKLH